MELEAPVGKWNRNDRDAAIATMHEAGCEVALIASSLGVKHRVVQGVLFDIRSGGGDVRKAGSVRPAMLRMKSGGLGLDEIAARFGVPVREAGMIIDGEMDGTGI